MTGNGPHYANGEKANDERQIDRPLLSENFPQKIQVAQRKLLWRLNVQDQQRNRDREHAIAKRLDTTSFLFIHTDILHSHHRRLSVYMPANATTTVVSTGNTCRDEI